ncbi:hypothetical protein AB6A40_000998 [Gnathostoma spinigerum]|uniref:Uncharacterized protein n=1 Tax=Gnathostoma spinigerum TaxID=75299 RepID=A0ABD6E7Z6_9BILA
MLYDTFVDLKKTRVTYALVEALTAATAERYPRKWRLSKFRRILGEACGSGVRFFRARSEGRRKPESAYDVRSIQTILTDEMIQNFRNMIEEDSIPSLVFQGESN